MLFILLLVGALVQIRRVRRRRAFERGALRALRAGPAWGHG